MNLKTYRAASMAQALADVKKDLGKDAVILHTRTFKVGTVMGLGGRTVVEITASDQAGAREARAGAATALAPARADEFVPSTPLHVRTREPLAATTKPVVAAEFLDRAPAPEARGEPRVPAPANVSRPAPPRPGLASRVALAPVDDSAIATLQDELAAIRRLVGQVLQCTRRTAVHVEGAAGEGSSAAAGILKLGGMPDPLFAMYLRLQEAQVASDVSEAIVGAVRDELTPGELADASVVSERVIARVASRLGVVGAVTPAGAQADSRPLTIALVGPTGVGKTTTIAKLAAMYKLRHAKRVGLITADTYRIAAVDQLRTYANIIGLPLRVVASPAEMASAAAALADHDVVLIDTAGRSQHDSTRLAELGRYVGAAKPHETHLVLSAAVAEPVLLKAAQRFGALTPDRVLFTKLDEAVHLGPILNVSSRVELPISYVTTGQEVPDQIDLADAPRLARRILDGTGGA